MDKLMTEKGWTAFKLMEERAQAAEDEVARLREDVKFLTEGLKGIASMGVTEGERMNAWAHDTLSGRVETVESELLKISDQRNKLFAHCNSLRGALGRSAGRLDLCAGKLEFVADGAIVDEARVWAEEVRQALAATPEQSLAKVRDSALEEAMDELYEKLRIEYADATVNDAMALILALKTGEGR